MPSYSNMDIRIGILIYDTNIVEVHSSRASNCSSGLMLHNCNNIHILNTTAMYSAHSDASETLFPIVGTGISLLSSANAIITDTSTMYNAGNGMVLKDTANVSVLCSSVMHNGYAGLNLRNTTRISVKNTSALHNSHARSDPGGCCHYQYHQHNCKAQWPCRNDLYGH